MITVYRYRVKNLSGELNRQSRVVNFVWNYCNESQKFCLHIGRKWLTHFDLVKLTTGTSHDLGIAAETINQICSQYVKSRRQKKKPFLKWRGRKNLGWVPFRASSIAFKNDAVVFYGKKYRLFMSRPLPAQCKIKDGGSFAQDSKGHWYVNITLEIPDTLPRPIRSAVGIDLGLKNFAALSNGEKIEAPQHFRKLEEKLGKAQRANKKRLAKTIHEKIKNTRKDFHHKLSRRIVDSFDWIAVGNVSASGKMKTRFAKSVSDAGWSSFRNYLAYKALACGATFKEVNEAYSSQACSSCGCLPPERPKGIAGLGIRQWTCGDCGAVHDRDLNAAINILVGSGRRTLAEGTLALAG